MDPNICLNEIRSLLSECEREGFTDYARLADLIMALDAWMTKGGFMPEAWSKLR